MERLTAWLQGHGEAGEVVALRGGASPRTYWRTRWRGQPAVVMLLPRDGGAGGEHGGGTDGEGERWLRFQDTLAARGLPVPAVLAADLPTGVLIIEDLGDQRLFDQITHTNHGLYDDAIDLLARWQVAWHGSRLDAPTFARPSITAELHEFITMGLERRCGVSLTPGEREVFSRLEVRLIDELLAAPQVLAHRDFQSQNLMVTPRGLVLIDFQDAFYAPDVYDLVALLRDSYVTLPPPDVARHVARFAGLTSADAALPRRFHLQTVQRKLKDAGRFETLATRGKTWFLEYFAPSITYVMDSAAALGDLDDLRTLLAHHLPEARRPEPAP